MGKFKFLFLLLLGFLFFICPQNVQAADTDVVINEVMANPEYSQGTESDHEWFELFNRGNSEIILDGWTVVDNNQTVIIPTFTLPSKDFLVIAATEEGFKENYPGFSGNLIILGRKIGNGLGNDGDRLILKDKNGEVDKISWGNDNTILNPAIPKTTTKGFSVERKPAGFDNNLASDFIIQTQPTPGNGVPESVILEDPEIDDDIVSLAWSKTEEDDFLKYEIYLSENKNELGDLLDVINGQEENFFEIENLTPGLTYYFVIRNYNLAGIYSDSNQVSVFLPIIYSKNIIINEILPHPQNGSDYEFIELYNSGNELVDISGWFLDDAEDGGSFPIPVDTTIKPGEYIAFYKNTIEPKTRISLNDSGDMARLLFPNGQIASSSVYNEYAAIGLSWARDLGGSWKWTTKTTAGGLNIISPPVIKDAGGEDEDIKIPVNDEPIEIKTGDLEKYRDYLVTVSGEITRTSGNTFYIDDGSGEIKVYIQEKTGIDKPEMHTGDIFEIIGVVNLYRNTWRLLPQKQDDIKLIDAIKKTNIASSKTTTSKKTTSSQTVSANTKARAPTSVKQVQAAEDTTSGTSTASKNSSFWINFVKMLVGLAIILLIIFVLKLRSIKKEKPIGADFGDDLT